MKGLLRKCRTIAWNADCPQLGAARPTLELKRLRSRCTEPWLATRPSQRAALCEPLPLIVDEVRALGRGFWLDRILTSLSPQPERFLVQLCDPIPSILVVAVLSAAASASDLSDDPPRPAPQVVSGAHEVLLRNSRTGSFA